VRPVTNCAAIALVKKAQGVSVVTSCAPSMFAIDRISLIS